MTHNIDNAVHSLLNEAVAPPGVDEIMRYEGGEMQSEEEVLDFFQRLYSSGMWQHLQGSYQRAVMDLLKQGLIDKDWQPPLPTGEPPTPAQFEALAKVSRIVHHPVVEKLVKGCRG